MTKIQMSYLLLAFATVLAPMVRGQSTPPQPKVTGVLTMLSPKPGVIPEQIMKIMPAEMLVAGVPWGMAKVRFEADNTPARDVLKWLILTEQQANSEASSSWHPDYNHWVVRCDGTGVPWGFIEVEGKFSPRCL
jgi:hypothetical protein